MILALASPAEWTQSFFRSVGSGSARGRSSQRSSGRNLLNGSLARKWMADAAQQLQMQIPALAGEVSQDGGLAVRDLTPEIPNVKWEEITREFFLT
jgi:hypothetical protein